MAVGQIVDEVVMAALGGGVVGRLYGAAGLPHGRAGGGISARLVLGLVQVEIARKRADERVVAGLEVLAAAAVVVSRVVGVVLRVMSGVAESLLHVDEVAVGTVVRGRRGRGADIGNGVAGAAVAGRAAAAAGSAVLGGAVTKV